MIINQLYLIIKFKYMITIVYLIQTGNANEVKTKKKFHQITNISTNKTKMLHN